MELYNLEKQKLSHPYYRIMELKGEELRKQLNSWSRLELIDWLCWNDRNGVYSAIDSHREFGEILSKKKALEIMISQIEES